MATFEARPYGDLPGRAGACRPARTTLLIDGHVHWYPGFGQAAFFESARANFARAAGPAGGDGAVLRVLALTERAPVCFFRDLRAHTGRDRSTWRVERTAEEISLIVRQGEAALVLVAGRQVVTAEGLEVLALGTDAELVDGRDLGSTVDAVRAAGAIPVLPWGFGKWWGRRGACLRRFLARAPRPLFLGDNGGRPRALPDPALFAEAAGRGIFVLPGSDPLPLPGAAHRVARCGFVLEGEVDPERPGAGLKRLLAVLEHPPATFGTRAGPARFVADQIALRWQRAMP